MTRFHRLELDQQLQPTTASTGEQRQAAALEERNWMTEADQARRQGHYETALRYYSRALELDRSVVAAWVGQVQMLVLLDECPEAELWGAQALEIFKNNGDLLAGRSQALCRVGDLAAAQVACDAALVQQGQSRLCVDGSRRADAGPPRPHRRTLLREGRAARSRLARTSRDRAHPPALPSAGQSPESCAPCRREGAGPAVLLVSAGRVRDRAGPQRRRPQKPRTMPRTGPQPCRCSSPTHPTRRRQPSPGLLAPAFPAIVIAPVLSPRIHHHEPHPRRDPQSRP